MSKPAKAPKVRWKVAPAPQGPYRSFHDRSWPGATYPDGRACARIRCDMDYVPARIKTGEHPPLVVSVADHSVTPWRWLRLKEPFPTLDQAKQGVLAFIQAHPHVQPDATAQPEEATPS